MDKNAVDQIIQRSITRRNALKLMGAGAATVSSAGLLAACGGDDDDDGGSASKSDSQVKGKKTGDIHNLTLLTNEWNTVMQDHAERAAKILGCGYAETVFDGDESKALNQAEQAIAAGAKGWILQGSDGSGIPAIARLANAENVYMTNMWATAAWYTPMDAGPNFVWWLTGSDEVNFAESTKYMLEKIANEKTEEAKLLHVKGTPGASSDSIRTYGAKQALKEFPGMKIVGSIESDWSAEGGQKATEDMISRYGEVDGIICQNDGMLTGALAACNGLGLKPGEDVHLCGADGASDILKAIEAGQATSTTFTSPGWFGVASAVHIFDALNGVEFSIPERQMGLVGVTVTKDNVSGVIKRHVDNENLPFDPRKMSKAISGDDFDPMAELRPVKHDTFWGEYCGVPKPSGYKYPPGWQKAIDSGEFEKVEEQYLNAYQTKFDDFDYEGVAV